MQHSDHADHPDRERLRSLPPLAGLCTLHRAAAANWSVEASVDRLKRLHYVLRRLCETFTAKITAEPIYELKMTFSHHAYLCAEQVQSIRRRVAEMREPPLGLEHVPHPGLERLMDELLAAPASEQLLLGCYRVALPAVIAAGEKLAADAHPLADAPTVRLAKLMCFELQEVRAFGEQLIGCLVDQERHAAERDWLAELEQSLVASGGLDGTGGQSEELPAARYSATPYVYASEPQRDARFQDSFNAGVNPEAFLYDERFSPRDKSLMMYYKRLREIDVPEMMASILVELR
ncbi:MAG: hypothetical protein KDA45_12775, partial [Planctomycetales bacterium]|nr:hypothetical protein [Planctomycetales bacterium]